MTITELKVRLYGDPCLRKKSSPVKEVGSGERLLIQSMILTMHQKKGVGLAAPQVGINQRIFVADVGDGPVVFINPKIVKKAGSSVFEEGCLSIPGININVTRPEKIQVSYIDENNRKQTKAFTDLMARVIQHENDHLDGKLIVDYASKEEKKAMVKKLEELENLNKKK